MKILHIMLIIILGVGIYFYFSPFELPKLIQQEQSTEQEQAATEEEKPTLPDISHMSEEELTALWANGERCPRKRFSVPGDKAPPGLVLPDKPGEPFLNFVQVYFTDDATCEDVERLAVFLDAIITGGFALSVTHEFQLPTITLEELEKTIKRVEALEHPKIKDVDKQTLLDFEEF